MSKVLAIGTAAAGLLAAPVIAVLALIGLSSNAIACTQLPATTLAATAPVPPPARLWIALTHSTCPPLPEPWIAAVMAQDSRFQPDAYSTNGGQGLFALDAATWSAAYGAPWGADLNNNGTPDVADPEIHAAVAGKYFCTLVERVDVLRPAHPGWASTRDLTDLEDLALLHHGGTSALEAYPALPAATQEHLRVVRTDTAAWSATPTPVAPNPSETTPSTGSSTPPFTVDASCVASLGSVGSVVVPPGTPVDVAAAIRASLDLVGTRSGWNNKCDRLACRAYGFANSGYDSATAHWAVMVATGHAHPGQRCPPVGAFVFWATHGPNGHVALVVASDPGCDPSRIKLVSNDVLNSRTGFDGGVYLVTLAQIESGFVTRAGYLGWSDPVCAGVRLPAATAAGT
jgi:hypothetical protein